jgi:hypothetical protein
MAPREKLIVMSLYNKQRMMLNASTKTPILSHSRNKSIGISQ